MRQENQFEYDSYVVLMKQNRNYFSLIFDAVFDIRFWCVTKYSKDKWYYSRKNSLCISFLMNVKSTGFIFVYFSSYPFTNRMIIAINFAYFYSQTETYRFRLEFWVLEDSTIPRQPEWFLQRLLWSVLSSFAGFVVRIPTLKESVFSSTQELNYA